MTKSFFLAGIAILMLCCSSGTPEVYRLPHSTIHFPSRNVGDSFDVHVSLPAGYDTARGRYPVIYYMDANLKSGKKLRAMIDEYYMNKQAIPAVFVGVGHFHSYRVLRRRDFITPFIKDKNDSLISDEKNFGQTEHFYRFMRDELIPHIEKNYRVTGNRTLVGHSLGGLFAFYCLFRNNRLFTNYVSLSPALWINYYNIYDFERKYRVDSAALHANLYMCVGGMEILNRIRGGARQMKDSLDAWKYPGLQFTYKEFEGETHNSEVPLALKMVLPQLQLQ